MNTISESINSVPIAGHSMHIVTIALLSLRCIEAAYTISMTVADP